MIPAELKDIEKFLDELLPLQQYYNAEYDVGCNNYRKEIKAILLKAFERGEMSRLRKLERKPVLDFLYKFFHPEITGNEKKCLHLADSIVETFGTPQVRLPEEKHTEFAGSWVYNKAIKECRESLEKQGFKIEGGAA